MTPIVYLNGEFLPLSQARVSVLDRGFTFGDGVYEVIPVFSGNMFRIREHLDRLFNSMTHIDIKLNYCKEDIIEILDKLLYQNPGSGDRQIYIQVTRGVMEREHVYHDDITPTFFAMCKPVEAKDFSEGVSAISSEDIRWKYCHIKGTALLSNVLLRKKANEMSGCIETILIRDGYVTEGAASNVFVVRDGVIMTPEKDCNVLPGITRDLLVELLDGSGMDCRETGITEQELRQADEIWITSSTMGLAPVIKLDGREVGKGLPGPYWHRTNQLYEAYKKAGSEK